MQIDEIRKTFASLGKQIDSIPGESHYKVTGCVKHRSLRSLQREAKMIQKQQKKAAKRGKPWLGQ